MCNNYKGTYEIYNTDVSEDCRNRNALERSVIAQTLLVPSFKKVKYVVLETDTRVSIDLFEHEQRKRNTYVSITILHSTLLAFASVVCSS